MFALQATAQIRTLEQGGLPDRLTIDEAVAEALEKSQFAQTVGRRSCEDAPSVLTKNFMPSEVTSYRRVAHLLEEDVIRRSSSKKFKTSTAAVKSLAAGQHLKQDGSEGEDVGSRIGLKALRLLRRHVRARTENHAGL